MRALLVCVLLLVAAPGGAQRTDSLVALSDTLEALRQRVGPAVVQIFVSGYAVGGGLVLSAEALVSPQTGSGAWVILDAAGYIITNAHVVGRCDACAVEAIRAATSVPCTRSRPSSVRAIPTASNRWCGRRSISYLGWGSSG